MSEVVTLLGSGAVGAVVAAIINGFFNKRKLSAEATNIISQAAGGVVQNLQDDNTRLRAANALVSDRERRTRRAIRKRDEEFREILDEHRLWDMTVAEKLRKAGIDVPDPPNLIFPDFEMEESEDIL